MITRRELLAEIEKCHRDPITYASIERLACMYIVYDHIGEERTDNKQITTPDNTVSYEGESDFAKAIRGKNPEKVWEVMEELMNVLRVTNPRLYDRVIDNIEK